MVAEVAMSTANDAAIIAEIGDEQAIRSCMD